ADTWVASLGYARAGLAVEAAAARGGRALDQEQLARLVALLERGAAGAPEGTVAAAELAEARAELTRITGRDDPEAWGRAVTAWSTVGFPWWRASALLRRAEALVSERGARAEAANLVADVLATTELLGATALAAAAHDLARRAGLAVPPAGSLREDPTDVEGRGSGRPSVPQQRSAAGEPDRDGDPLESLTSREREVVALLSAGASNRRIAQQLFISEKTASVHVSHILAKLGVSSRLEAAAVAHRASR
ncbi:MAG TPA: response regulator transcription factor, partial [Candidatus Limnocylindria bacterium]|nr:response regulator transcription factor [Candidatus Limnocylindria bacterium]